MRTSSFSNAAFQFRHVSAVAAITAVLLALPERVASGADEGPVPSAGLLEAALPQSWEDVDTAALDRLRSAAAAADEAGARDLDRVATGDAGKFAALGRLLEFKSRVDQALDTALAARAELSADDDDFAGHGKERARRFLEACTILIDLSGRLRYLQYDAFSTAIGQEQRDAERLLSLAIDHQSSIGLAAIGERLLSAPEGTWSGARFSRSLICRMLQSIRAGRHADLLPLLCDFVTAQGVPAELVVEAALAIRALGLPQDPRPGDTDPASIPPITADVLRRRLASVHPRELAPDLRGELDRLRSWLSSRAVHGVTEEGLQLGSIEVRPGDWLLMKNPSPYNRFTDLAPGLFTHVGVVASETGTDGKVRLVMVEVPERGTHIPATNVDRYVDRTLHYVFLRHPDPEQAARMAKVAADVIGNPVEFDLNFRNDPLAELKGQDLRGRKITAYCAGLLALCGQETRAEQRAYFPFEEGPTQGLTRQNLARLGLNLPDDFISPTGALFSPLMTLVGRREPMYSPLREIEESVYDHFALRLAEVPIVPTPDLKQFLELKAAEAARQSPTIARILAQVNQVSPEMDLVSAARAAAVVETLDQAAYGASEAFADARTAVMASNLSEFAGESPSEEDRGLFAALAARHAGLRRDFLNGKVSARGVRKSLVTYYVDLGCQMIDNRFFPTGH